MQQKSQKKPFVVVMSDETGKDRNVKVKAVDAESAAARAEKFQPNLRVVDVREA